MTSPAWAATAQRFLHAAALCLGLASTAHAANWQSAGFISGGRSQHSATQLPDGRVLVAGGFDGTNALATTRFFDPVAQTWTDGPSLPTTARRGHTATLLRNGELLIAGGANEAGAIGTTLTFDVQTGQFTAAGNLVGPRSHHTATLLQDGRVFVMGGDQNGSALSVATLYDPTTRTWKQNTHTLTAGRRNHSATLLPNGHVLVAGGENAAGALAEAWIWNPANGQWTAGPPLPSGARWGHTATLLPGGRVLIAGGRGAAGTYHAQADIYDSSTGTWAASVPHAPRTRHAATLLPDGRVLLTGGDDAAGYVAASAIYSPGSGFAAYPALIWPRREHNALLLNTGTVLVTGGVWPSGALMYVETNHPAEPRQRPTATLPEDRKDHQATRLPSGNVLVTGGLLASAPGTPNAGALRYRPEVGAGSAVWLATAAMIQPRQSHTQTLLPGTGTHGRVLVAGGFSGPQGWQDSAEIYDEATNAWTRTLPMLHKHSGHTATLLADGSVLVAGGSDGPQASAYTETYAPAGNQWQAAGSMGSQREFHTATLLADGRVLVAGGWADSPSSGALASVEFYDPATRQWSAGPAMAQPRYGHTALPLPDGRVLVLDRDLSNADIFDPAANAWSPAAPSPSPRGNYTATVLPDGRVLVAGGGTPVGGSTVHTARAELFDPARNTWTRTADLSQACAHHSATLLASGGVLLAGCGASLFDEPVSPASRPPAITSAGPVPLVAGAPLALAGLRFTGDSEGGSGGANQSASNTPLLSLQSVNGGPVHWLAAQVSDATSFTSRSLPALQAGWHRATLYVNGMASGSMLLPVEPPAMAAPDAPTGVTATPGNAQVTVSWQAPAGGTPPTSYTVTAQPGGASCTVQAPATSCTVTGLTNGVTYTFTVTAHHAGGSASAPPTGGVAPAPGGSGDPGGLQPVPTLSDWSLLLLAAWMALTGWQMYRRARLLK
ncbi:MAG TPA: IPTL-CTERM sorting domain-containing protein [Ottowia sp.]|nr:IPTL-CTERM sorting domain-containing protein [Ottowia sp.]